MIHYRDGQDVCVGDIISLDDGVRVGTVELIVESSEDIAVFDVDGPGILVVCEYYGRVFILIQENHDDEVALIKRNGA